MITLRCLQRLQYNEFVLKLTKSPVLAGVSGERDDFDKFLA